MSCRWGIEGENCRGKVGKDVVGGEAPVLMLAGIRSVVQWLRHKGGPGDVIIMERSIGVIIGGRDRFLRTEVRGPRSKVQVPC